MARRLSTIARRWCAQADKDRFLATLFAPAKYRRPLFALYAFNLEVARVRELAREPMPGEIRLQWWRDVFAGAGRGEVRANPVAAALLDTVVRYRLPPRALLDLIDARSFDLYDDPMATLDGARGYARKTSSALMATGRAHPQRRQRSGYRRSRRACRRSPMRIAGLLAAFPLHAARRQLYRAARSAAAPRRRAGDRFRRQGDARTARRACRTARCMRAAHLAAAQAADRPRRPTRRAGAAAGRAGAALRSTAWSAAVTIRSSRPTLPQWRRQWILWRAARSGLAQAL